MSNWADRSGTAVGPTAISSGDLFAAYHTKIRRYILSMVRDPVEADDLTQDVFLQVHRKLDSLRDPDAIVSWLYRIATHVSYDRFRVSSRRPRIEPLDAQGWEPAGREVDRADGPRLDRVVERKEMSSCVRRFMEDLSDEYRQVILLHDLEGLTNPEIAEMLGVTTGAVKIRLHRARSKLEIALSAGCDFSRDEEGVLVCEPAAGRPAPASSGRAQPSQGPVYLSSPQIVRKGRGVSGRETPTEERRAEP